MYSLYSTTKTRHYHVRWRILSQKTTGWKMASIFQAKINIVSQPFVSWPIIHRPESSFWRLLFIVLLRYWLKKIQLLKIIVFLLTTPHFTRSENLYLKFLKIPSDSNGDLSKCLNRLRKCATEKPRDFGLHVPEDACFQGQIKECQV